MDNVKAKRKIIEKDNIELLELIKTVWVERRKVLFVTAFFMVLGVIYSILASVEYQAQCKLLPESSVTSKSKFGGLSSLAGLAGIDMESGGAEILDPSLYPEIVNSTPFQQQLLNEPLYFADLDTTISYAEYFRNFQEESIFGIVKAYAFGLIGQLKKNPNEELNKTIEKANNVMLLTKEEVNIIASLKNQISVEITKGTSIISIKTVMPDSYASAELCSVVVKNLRTFLIRHTTLKSEENLIFIENSFNEAKREYQTKMNSLALFEERNLNLSSRHMQSEYQQLQNEMNVAFEVYKNLANQLEQAKIQIKRKAPVYTTLEPPQVPVDKSNPKRMIIVLLFATISFVFVVLFIVAKRLVKDLVNKEDFFSKF